MINVTVGEQKTQSEKPFPKLMITQNGYVFYMIREKYGLPLTSNNWAYDMDDFADLSETKYDFTDYNEPITLQNI